MSIRSRRFSGYERASLNAYIERNQQRPELQKIKQERASQREKKLRERSAKKAREQS